MKKQFKRILALILALAMALSLSVTAFAAEAAPETDGNALLRASSEETDVLWWSIAGPDAVCTFYSNGDLVFSGSGTIDTTHYNWRNNRDNTPSSFPQEYYALVKNIVIDEGITAVGRRCFNLGEFDHPSVYIPSTLKTVEPCGFMSRSCTVPDYTNYLESEIAINRGFEGAGTVYIADMDAWCRCNFKDPLANPGFNADHIIYQGKELTHVDVPNGPNILCSTFAGWKNLESVKIPSSVNSLDSTFFGSGLREIYLPSSVTTLWNTWDYYYQGDAIDETGMYYGSFGSCTRLKNVYMPGVDLVQAYTFTNCTSLNTLVFGSDVGFLHAENWSSHDVFFTNCPSTLTIYAPKNYPEFKGFNYKSLTAITKIEITVPRPVVGKTGDEVGKIPTIKTVPADAFTMSDGDWWNVSDGTYFTGKFEAGKSYSFGINLAPKDGYIFECDGDNYLGEIVVNGGTFELTKSDGPNLFLSTIVKCEKYLCAAPTLNSLSNATAGVVFKWSKVDGAAKYRVFRKVYGGTYAKLADVTGTSYTDSTAKSGTKYVYTVRCLNADGTYASAQPSGKSILRLANPTLSGVTNTSTGVKVAWAKTTGATGYYVYRKSGTGDYKKIKSIASATTTTLSWTDTTAVTGTKYTYMVRAYNGTTLSSYAGKSIVRLVTPAISKLTNVSGRKMKVTWAKKSGVSGYQIQYSTSSTFASGNKTVTVSGASTVTKTIGSLTKGKTYYVRIRTYKTVSDVKYYSGWSAKKSVKISK